MSANEDFEPILSAKDTDYVGSTPFADDKLNRKQLAEKLTSYLGRLTEGAVLAIDAPWGEGKTWFGKNWAKSLKNEEHKIIYIDAFEQDYIEDPFMLITAEILELFQQEDGIIEDLKHGGTAVTKALLPFTTKALINLGGRFLLGSSDISEEFKEAIEAGTMSIAELSNKWITENLEAYTQDKVVMQEFKSNLAEFACTQDKPIIIFIDELDRCNPKFAVNLVERIKHFFDVPNIVFVLLLNRDQLEKAVRGVYGTETDASTYLGKFVNFFFKLPKSKKHSYQSELMLTNFINATMNKYKFQKTKQHDSFIIYMKFWAPLFNMSLRDIEKATALYAFAYPVGEVTWILTYLIVIKVTKPSLFDKLINNDLEAHTEAKVNIETFIIDDERYNHSKGNRVFSFFLEWHEAHLNGFTDMGESFKEDIGALWGIEKKDLLSHLAKSIELDIDI